MYSHSLRALHNEVCRRKALRLGGRPEPPNLGLPLPLLRVISRGWAWARRANSSLEGWVLLGAVCILSCNLRGYSWREESMSGRLPLWIKTFKCYLTIVYKVQFLLSSCPNIFRMNVQNGPASGLHTYTSWNRSSSLSRGKGIKYDHATCWARMQRDIGRLGTFLATVSDLKANADSSCSMQSVSAHFTYVNSSVLHSSPCHWYDYHPHFKNEETEA